MHFVCIASYWNSESNSWDEEVRVELYISGQSAEERFRKLQEHKDEIEVSFGESLHWHEVEDVKLRGEFSSAGHGTSATRIPGQICSNGMKRTSRRSKLPWNQLYPNFKLLPSFGERQLGMRNCLSLSSQRGAKKINNATLDPALPEQDRCREQEVNGRKRSQKAHEAPRAPIKNEELGERYRR